MKRIFPILLALCLIGCSSQKQVHSALVLRDKLLHCESCSFTVDITADYGDKIYTFTMSCQADSVGNVRFSVVSPETIRDITGKLSVEGGALTFDDQMLAFPMLADGQITPVSAPWILIKTLRSGYIRCSGADGEYEKTQIDDSYEANALQLDIWFSDQQIPIRADILYEGRRFLSMEIKLFRIV